MAGKSGIKKTGNSISRVVQAHNGCVVQRAQYPGMRISGKVYENALLVEIESQGLHCTTQAPFNIIFYRDKKVGVYVADIVVEDRILLELKAVRAIEPVHRAQVINYLRASGLKLGIILNFARPKLEFERIVL